MKEDVIIRQPFVRKPKMSPLLDSILSNGILYWHSRSRVIDHVDGIMAFDPFKDRYHNTSFNLLTRPCLFFRFFPFRFRF